MIKLLKNIKLTEWLVILVSVVLIYSQVWLELEMPAFMKEITTLTQQQNPDLWQITLQGIYMLLYAFGSLVSSIVVSFMFSKLASRFSARLRKLMFQKTTDFSMEEINTFSTPSLITRSTNDVNQVQMIISMGAQLIIKAPILAVASILKISSSEWQWTLATGIAIFLIASVLTVIILFAVPKFKKIQKNTDELNKTARENLMGLRVIKAFNAEEYQAEKVNKVNNVLMKDGLFTGRIMSLMNPTMGFVMSGVSLSIYWIGAFLINNIGINPQDIGGSLYQRGDLFANMMVFSSYAMQVIMAFMMLIMIFIILPRAQVSANRIQEVLSTNTKIKNGNKSINEAIKTIEYKNVSFKYPGASDLILEDLNFKISKGQTVAIIGATGSGKTTLINLLPRFYDASEGEILINNENIKDFKQEELTRKIGYISQQAFLFSGSIESNINYGIDDKEVRNDLSNALYVSQAKEFIDGLEEKEASRVSQAGKNFSGGQKQRLSIARAIQKNADVLIFDDSFSALDYKTDAKLRKALNETLKDQITIIVAQRIGTIQNADIILVIDEGKIVGQGTHKELLESNKVYKEIALSQLSEEELANA